MSTNSTLDPYTQVFTLITSSGEPFNVSVADLDEFNFYNTKICINYASQLGATLIMLLVVLLVTNPNKRKARLFWINVTSLVLSFVRSLLQTLYYTGPFTEAYRYFAFDFSDIPRSAYANSVAASFITWLLLCCIELSLFLQVQVITRAIMGGHHRRALLSFSGVVVALAVGFRFGLTVRNAKAILALKTSYNLQWLASGALVMETISIWYFCLVFVAKLGFCIYERKRKLSLKPWGPMEVICIMGGCTMIIPSIFAIIEYFPDSTFPEAGSLALTLVALFLPLSSIWAAATPEGASPIFRSDSSDQHHKLGSCSTGHTIQSSRSRLGDTSETKLKGSAISPTTVSTVVEYAPRCVTNRQNGGVGQSDARADDLIEVEPLDSVLIERSYSIYSGNSTRQSGRY